MTNASTESLIGRPTTSSARRPNSFSPWRLHARTTPSRSSNSVGSAIDPKIESFLDRVDRHLAQPGGDGYREKLPSNTIRLQNPHMHLYESLLLL